MKLNKISIKSVWVLSFIAVISLIGFYLAENFKVYKKAQWYDEKLAAAELSEKSREYLKNYRLKNAIFVDNINDPNETGIIGQKYTAITTDRGELAAKTATTNPNFAAVIVEFLKTAGIQKGDKVAVAVTGSFPGLNISVYSALSVLGAEPIIITSVGSSNWGANDPDFTWLDMETILNEAGLIRFKSIAASVGGGQDIGRGLSPEGRSLIFDAISRNNIKSLYNEDFMQNIEHRMELYNKHSDGKEIKVFINVGGGMASLGSSITGDLVPTGLTMILPMKNYPAEGVLIKMAKKGIPIIHLSNLAKLIKKYELVSSRNHLPSPGEGSLYSTLKYNFTLVLVITIILILVITFFVYFDRKNNKLGAEILNENNTNNEEIL